MTPDEKRSFALQHAVHVGVDTSKTFHVLVARGPDGRRRAPYRVPVSRAGFEGASAHLAALFPSLPPRAMLVGLEFAGHHGFTFARYLAAAGHPVVNVLPAHTKRTKEIEDNSPLKTDAKDAALICKLVGDGTFVQFPFLRPPFVELRLLTVQRYRLTVEATRFKNRLRGILDLAWPEFLGHFSTLRKATPRALLERWPLPQDLLAVDARTVRAHARSASRGHFSAERVRRLLADARTTIALPDAPDDRRREIRNLLARWTLVDAQLAAIEARLGELVEQCPEARALITIPEVSAVCAATLVAELGTPADYQHPRQILKLAGMNLVEKSSGLSHGRRRQSKRGRPMLRRQLYLLAGRWCLPRGLYRPDYLALCARNGGHRTKAVCSIARKLVPLLWRVMQSGEPFDRERWLAQRHVQRPSDGPMGGSAGRGSAGR
jgi:transposase